MPLSFLCAMTPTTPHHLYILTGASRGMGRAMAEQLLAPGHTLLTLARRPDAALAAQAGAVGATLVQWAVDLADAAPVAARLADWLRAQDGAALASATLINNAGAIPAIVPLRDADPAELASALRVGLEAPMQLTAAFLRATSGWSAARRVLNISSGNGRRAMASQSLYSAAKAGMDHYTRCLALEEGSQANGARVCSLAPGIIDTDMQTHLRSAGADTFPDHARFVQYHSSGQLLSIDAAAERVLRYLARPDFGDNPAGDVRD